MNKTKLKQKLMIWGCENCGVKWETEDIKDKEGLRIRPDKCPSCGGSHLWIKSFDSFKEEFKKNLRWHEKY